MIHVTESPEARLAQAVLFRAVADWRSGGTCDCCHRKLRFCVEEFFRSDALRYWCDIAGLDSSYVRYGFQRVRSGVVRSLRQRADKRACSSSGIDQDCHDA